MSTNQMVSMTSGENTPTELTSSTMLCDQYQSGARDFSDRDFCGFSLHSSCLSYANFRRSKLKQVNLQDADLRGIDLSETDLSRSNLQNTDLRGAALDNAMLFMASLDGANLQGADLSGASLDITTLNQANLQGANLCGTYLCGMDLSQVDLRGAYFDNKTQFDADFDPASVGMRSEITISIDDIVAHFNRLSKCASRYLGHTIALKYWEKSRYQNRHIAAFHFNPTGQFSYSGPSDRAASFLQLKWAQLWTNRFVGNCAVVFQDFPNILERNQLLLIGLESITIVNTDDSTGKSMAIFG
ncbi:pentapeptide repeat-containing protein [filamentous cyanobacterium LEGE 11480]|uniref:Pentapeptide repeat-containing protein n=1 Tax=Romeriopsis navalis LEGE 11480 TaxID=2777977 RepID=A0A928Z2W4_9CYAN|nr:pentapeptide repeat-containing protein [Romeriopsis navalis]MBE9029989.1 pentapeptide repeat-containing protein [Romeriopsis navalis LEGE 11480]